MKSIAAVLTLAAVPSWGASSRGPVLNNGLQGFSLPALEAAAAPAPGLTRLTPALAPRLALPESLPAMAGREPVRDGEPARPLSLGQPEPPAAAQAPAGAPADAPSSPPPPPSQERFREIVDALHGFRSLSIPIGVDRPSREAVAAAESARRELQGIADAALRKKDALLLAQLALLTGARTDPQARNVFYMALYSLELSHLIASGPELPSEVGLGYEARKARDAVDRHTWTPLGPVTREDGVIQDARDWLRDQVLARYRAAYP